MNASPRDAFWQEENIQWIENHLFTPTSFERANAVWPARLGRNEAKPNYHVGPRFTPYYSLHYVVDGIGFFSQEDHTYSLKSGDLFCLFPHVSQEYYTSAEHPLKLAWVAFDGRMAKDVLDRIGLRPESPYLSRPADAELERRMESFFALIRKDGGDGAELMKSSIFLGILGWLTETAEKPSRKEAGAESWLDKGMAYMNLHFAEGITVQEISKYAGVDRTYFSKSFRKAYGMTPVRYLQQLKIDAAKSMLAETEYKLAEIAQSVGYPDLFTFSKAFKKHVGLPPNHYRHLKH
ncbi:AraC family transcriptional regulator [Paenibacillus lycopersici]|uniref:AraC family transcriptional regulator n=1 Tax=Paenibacillus lycopersici TaxID=2704462 RepID=A0A6C0G0C2_9BACL|nr:AraC family transcriptional regulator [Paenibacillus lycopersici]QHT61181.1 AraC family transcriptional regulator [Paenibacillus lycopersici]